MNWKVGDYFRLKEGLHLNISFASHGKIYRVKCFYEVPFSGQGISFIDDRGDIGQLHSDHLARALKASKLNKKLYPNYIEDNGYLIPQKTVDKN